MNLRKTRAPRLRLATLLAVVGLLALVSSAAAVIYVYKNGFNTRSAYKEIEQTGGGNACDKDYLEESTSMRIEVAGQRFCEYAPPISGDRDQPDHEIVVQGRILSKTPKNVRERSYLGVRVRVGNGTYYEFRVFPKIQEYKLNREPEGDRFPSSDGSGEIEKLDENNKLRLRVTGDKVAAFVNGAEVDTIKDPKPGQVEGRKVSFGVGSTKNADGGPIGVIKSVKVGVPSP